MPGGDYIMSFDFKIEKSYKAPGDNNPVMVQRFGADPYAMVYGGRVYVYMTLDDPAQELDENGEVKENSYSKIDKISVISSDDLVNWTDHGTVYAAGDLGAANWGKNSWAPAAAWKNIDGKDRFFLYFANSGNGIAVLSADSPVGPFTDPINGPLISRDTPTCAEVTWLFDPAVLMDDDGNSYIFFGGGVPSDDVASNPGTARVAKLGADMISLEGDPKPIENVSYLFEDSGINKIGGRYFYSYCSNFSMSKEAEKEKGFEQGEIVTMVSDDPMGPFKMAAPVLKNPGHFFGLGGNNHHCMFEFGGKYYIAYHSRILEESMGLLKGYRCTGIDSLELDQGSAPSKSVMTRKGAEQVKAFNPYEETKAVTMSNAAGIATRQFGEEAQKYGSGDMIVTGIHSGSWVSVSGADFGESGAKGIEVKVKSLVTDSDAEGGSVGGRIGSAGQNGLSGKIHICLDSPEAEPAGSVIIGTGIAEELTEITGSFDRAVTGKHDVYFVFEGEGFEFYSWKFLS